MPKKTVINKIPHITKKTKIYERKSSLVPQKNPFPSSWRIFVSGILSLGVCLLLFLYIDRPAALAMHALDPAITGFFIHVTRLGKSTAYLVTFGVLFLLLYPASKIKRWQEYHRRLRKYALCFLFLFISIAASGLLTDFLKVIFARYRPVMLYEAGKYGFTFFKFSPASMLSFPSGHANTIFAFMTALYLIVPRYRFVYFTIAVLVAASRVIIGAHFPSDVIAGAYLGVVTTLYLKGLFLSWGMDIFNKKA